MDRLQPHRCDIALGPAAGEQKVSLHYAVLYNIPKPVRFNINNIMLVTAVYSKDVKKYSVKQVISGDGNDSSWAVPCAALLKGW